MSNRVLSVGSQFPAFKKKAVVSIEKGKEFIDLTNEYATKEMDGNVLVAKGLYVCLSY